MKTLLNLNKIISREQKARHVIKTLVITVLFVSCKANTEFKNKNVNYNTLAKEFIENFKQDTIAFNLSEKVVNFKFFMEECKVEFENDTNTLTRDEKKYVINHYKNNNLKKWTNDLVPNARIISSKTITNIFKVKSGGNWPVFKEKFGKDLYNFSAPVFLRNNSYCILYFNKRCGNLCGFGGYIIYKKTNNKWQSFKNYCAWIN